MQQQWIQYGNDARLGNDKDLLLGNHGGSGRFVVQGDASPTNPPLICSNLPDFVELRGGDYFFLPSVTALGMIAVRTCRISTLGLRVVTVQRAWLATEPESADSNT